MIDFFKQKLIGFLESLQNTLCSSLESVDGKAMFVRDPWRKKDLGWGETRVLSGGSVIEKAAVNFSAVSGILSKKILEKLGGGDPSFFAAGVSLIVHPKNPHVPCTHANWRYIEKPDRAWFGGGMDLTPYFLNEEAFRFWHGKIKKSCDAVQEDFYPRFKKSCDDYFFLPHRQEHRGIGGIFFDMLDAKEDAHWKLFQSNAHCFSETYTTLVKNNAGKSFSERDKYWQELRRGRYVEFNLLHDRGTLFGLETGGMIESILCSMPPKVRWDYKGKFETEEQKRLLEILKHPQEWV
jgi:coproporphyrinogen III oxidase